MQTKEIYKYLDSIYPFNTQAEWDTSRLVSNHKRPIKTIVVALDLDANTLAYSIKHEADLIITHHPLFIEPMTNETLHARKIFDSLESHKIDAIFLHTPFDQSKQGVNFAIAEKLQLKNLHFPSDSHNYVIAELTKSLKLIEYIDVIKQQLNLDYIKIDSSFANKKISTIAICGGSGGSFIPDLKPVDAYLTCDLKYHAWIDAVDLKLALIDVNHNVENIFVKQITQQLKTVIPVGTKLLTNESQLKFKII